MNFLATSETFISFAIDAMPMTDLNWLGKVIQWIIEGVGIFAVGVMLFTLVLKTIVLPLDAYSRVKSKKQALIMERMRPQMEKLQKQYANDKQMYQQKVMELQKKNGYSMLSACIPMIVSLVIFIFVFQAFSTYSQYANLTSYNKMVEAYNMSVDRFVYSRVASTADEVDRQYLTAEGSEWTLEIDEYVRSSGFLKEELDNSIMVTVDAKDGDKTQKKKRGNIAFAVDYDKFSALSDCPEEFKTASGEAEKMAIVKTYIQKSAQKAAADCYHANSGPSSMLWIKNIWYPDSMLNKEVPDFSGFSSSVSRAVGSGLPSSYADSYNEVTRGLSAEKDTYNGYFVLIVLAIGFMFLQQFIMMRSQKSVNELGSVDGSGKRTNRWMMILMPIIFGIFSFFYSAAFSIYMITNTVYGLITTLIINKIVAVRFAKREEAAEIQKMTARSAPKRKRLK